MSPLRAERRTFQTTYTTTFCAVRRRARRIKDLNPFGSEVMFVVRDASSLFFVERMRLKTVFSHALRFEGLRCKRITASTHRVQSSLDLASLASSCFSSFSLSDSTRTKATDATKPNKITWNGSSPAAQTCLHMLILNCQDHSESGTANVGLGSFCRSAVAAALTSECVTGVQHGRRRSQT